MTTKYLLSSFKLKVILLDRPVRQALPAGKDDFKKISRGLEPQLCQQFSFKKSKKKCSFNLSSAFHFLTINENLSLLYNRLPSNT